VSSEAAPDLLPARGHFVLVVGPSGAGKDTLLRGAQAALAEEPAIVFVRRVITRPPDASEQNEGVDAAAFEARRQAGAFALSWHAHGLSYGVPAETLAQVGEGRLVVCNGSRGVIGQAREVFGNPRVVLVTAPKEVLAARLRARGRDGDIEGRLARDVARLGAQDCELVIENVGDAAAGIGTLVSYLRALVAETGRVAGVSCSRA
jgi:ribose 1,5-bisphosphokinase